MKKPTLVIGVIGADCHAVGNKVLDRVFTAHNFNVINLGVMVSQDEYIDAAIETGADAIVVSSIYGHGILTAWGFVSAASNVVSEKFHFMLAAIWWLANMTLLMSKKNSKRWDLTEYSRQVMTWKMSVSSWRVIFSNTGTLQNMFWKRLSDENCLCRYRFDVD